MSSRNKDITANELKYIIDKDLKKKGFSYLYNDPKMTAFEKLFRIKHGNESAVFQFSSYDEKYKFLKIHTNVEINKEDKDNKKNELRAYFISLDSTKLIPVGSVSDYIDNVLARNDEVKFKASSNVYYHAQKAYYDNYPTLFSEPKFVEKEFEINSRIYNDRPAEFLDCNSTFDRLVRLRHFDTPSRLFDLTSNPLVALYFACASRKVRNEQEKRKQVGVILEAYSKIEKEKQANSSDSVVLLSSITLTKKMEQMIHALSDSRVAKGKKSPRISLPITCARQKAEDNHDDGEKKCQIIPKKIDDSNDNKNWSCRFDDEKNRDNKSNVITPAEKSFIGELIHQCRKEDGTQNWEDLCFNELNQSLLVKPPLNNDRIVRQSGCFIMCGLNPYNIYEPPESFYDFFELDVCDEDIPKRVVYHILPEKREQILKDLKKLGIDNYFLFPELEKDISEVIGEYKC